MLTRQERDSFTARIIDEVHRWSAVEVCVHPGATVSGEPDGVEFRLYGRQFGHVHADGSVHLVLTKGLKSSVLREGLAEPLPEALNSGWVMFAPFAAADVERAIWLLRLNYVRFRRQRLTPGAAESSDLLREHEIAVSTVSANVAAVLKLTRARSRTRPLPSLEPQPASQELNQQSMN